MRSEELVNDIRVRGICVSPSVEDDWDELRGSYEAMAVLPRQTHSLNVAVIERDVREYPDTDALVSFDPARPVGVLTADCVPVLLFAPDIGAVAAAHAGWKGTLGGILDNVMDCLLGYGASAREMRVFFGPSISMRNYEVDRELASRFVDAGFGEQVHWPSGVSAKPHLDLQGTNALRLERRGVPHENIALHAGCTFGSVDATGEYSYRSHRRSNGDPARNLTFITLKTPEIVISP